MNYFINYGWLRFMAVICSLLLLSACATTKEAEISIEERATQRWEALLGGDLAGAYEYLPPGARSSITSMQYQRTILTQRVAWTAARYVGSECEESTCVVNVSLDYSVYGALPGVKSFKGTKDVKESWVLVEGIWYLVP